MNIESWFLGSRKFLVMLAIILLGSSFRIAGLISGDGLVSLLSSVGMAFMAANSVEQMMAPIQTWVKGKISPSIDGDNK